jgi:hypothetical protein
MRRKLKTILVSSLIAVAMIVVTQQQAKAVFPTAQQNEELKLLHTNFWGIFMPQCYIEQGLKLPHDLTINEAMKCPKAFNTFKELTGGTDSDVIGLIVDELRGYTAKACGPVALTNENIKRILELTKELPCLSPKSN